MSLKRREYTEYSVWKKWFSILYLFSHCSLLSVCEFYFILLYSLSVVSWLYISHCFLSYFSHTWLLHAHSSFLLCLCQKYVQDALREQLSETVYQCLKEEGGHIYVCGDVTMAGDVLKTVQQIIKQQGNMSLEDAGFFISKLRVREREKVHFTVQHRHHDVHR